MAAATLFAVASGQIGVRPVPVEIKPAPTDMKPVPTGKPMLFSGEIVPSNKPNDQPVLSTRRPLPFTGDVNKTMSPTSQPINVTGNVNKTMSPTSQPINKTMSPLTSQPVTLKPIKPVPVPVTKSPISKPTLKPIKPGTCKSNFYCKKPIFCGKPNFIPPKPFLKNCACDFDIYGKPICWQNMSCKDMFQSPCNKVKPCKTGKVCVPLKDTCCEKYYTGPLKNPSFCVTPCFTKGPPYSPKKPDKPCTVPSALGFC
jgi:hypothetical protein